MTGEYRWPRLPRGAALALLRELHGLDPATARARADTSHPAAALAPTGSSSVPEEVIRDTARAVRELADRLGFPTPLSRPHVATFDGPCGDILVERMRIVPSDAAAEGVWSFITLVVLPDVALWRFPDMSQERFVGQPRNTFRRLWWRSFTLAGANAPVHGSEPLGEDELVNIFERPSISRSANLARTMVYAVRSLQPTAGVPRSEVMRELAKRIRRLLAFICVDVLPQEELNRLVWWALEDSVWAVRSGARR